MTETTLELHRVRLPKRTLAYIRNIGPYMGDTELFKRLFNKVSGSLAKRNLFGPNSEAITVYHDDPETVAPEKQRISVGFTVADGTQPDDDIQILGLPEGDFVVGSFELLPSEYGEAWTNTFAFMGEEGLQPTGLMYESYKSDPKEHSDGRHKVDICVAVKWL